MQKPRGGMQMKAWRSEAYDQDTKKLLWVGRVTETDTFEAVRGQSSIDLRERQKEVSVYCFQLLILYILTLSLLKKKNLPASSTFSLVSL